MDEKHLDEMDEDQLDDRGELIERRSRSARLWQWIGIALFIVIGLTAAYFVLTDGGRKELVIIKGPTINENVPGYTLPPSESSPVVVTKADPPPDKPVAPETKPSPPKIIIRDLLPKLKKPEIIVNPSQDSMLERLLTAELGSPIKDTSAGADTPRLGARQSDGVLPSSNIDYSVTPTPLVLASRLPNLAMTIPKGTPIQCALNVAIQSDQPGLLTCVVNEDIYGADGTVILVDRGSSVTGEYRRATLSVGRVRLFAIWDRIRLPDGVVVDLASPVTDSLGRAGIGGWVNRHYLERFGSALLVSMIDDIFVSISNDDFANTTDETQRVSAAILNEYANIQPTLHKPQGGAVNIMVARDLDFTAVYELAHAN